MAADPLKIPTCTDPGRQTLPVQSDLVSPNVRVRVHYISDLHLDMKLERSGITDIDVAKEYLKQVASQIKESFLKNVNGNSWEFINIVIICGDLSADINVNRYFLSCLRDLLPLITILYIPGNHEFCGEGCSSTNLNGILAEYGSITDGRDLFFLQNSLFVFKNSNCMILTEDDLKKLGLEELGEICKNRDVAVLGSAGFSAPESQYDVSSEMYKKALTLEEDFIQTETFRKLHEKVLSAIGGQNLIVATHIPIHGWIGHDKPGNTIYINGHTHINDIDSDDGYVDYHDNQVGYESEDYSLKCLDLIDREDSLCDLPDGIYAISAEDYRNFYRHRNVYIEYDLGPVTAVKRGGHYCFLLHDKERYYLLRGGQKRRFEFGPDYVYQHMAGYVKVADQASSEYSKQQKQISDMVTAFGGTGKVHGCIIDIDFFSHLYFNPIDFTITPYFAWSMVDKTPYPSIDELLKTHVPDLLDAWKKLSSSEGFTLPAEVSIIIDPDGSLYMDEHMYGRSALMKAFQYIESTDTIRVWNNELLKNVGDNRILPVPEIRNLTGSATSPVSIQDTLKFNSRFYDKLREVAETKSEVW